MQIIKAACAAFVFIAAMGMFFTYVAMTITGIGM